MHQTGINPTTTQWLHMPPLVLAVADVFEDADRSTSRIFDGVATGVQGERSLLAAGSRPAQHGWPVADTPGTPSRVALVARTSWSGLTAAQRAATEWASGVLGDSVQLVGLVLIPDAPGRLPKPLRDLQHVIAGGVPRVWTLPWVDAWRLGPVDPSVPVPKEFRALLADLQLSPSGPAHN